jgi:hypothetical protein
MKTANEILQAKRNEVGWYVFDDTHIRQAMEEYAAQFKRDKEDDKPKKLMKLPIIYNDYFKSFYDGDGNLIFQAKFNNDYENYEVRQIAYTIAALINNQHETLS